MSEISGLYKIILKVLELMNSCFQGKVYELSLSKSSNEKIKDIKIFYLENWEGTYVCSLRVYLDLR